MLKRAGGDTTDFDELCASNPQLAEELALLRAEWDANAAATAPPTSPTRAAPLLDELLGRLAEPAPRSRRYEFEGEIARGGMGVVHRVWDADLRRHLALKTLRASLGSSRRAVFARFIEEAQIVAQLDHPAIVPIHDMGVDERGRPFFVLKLVAGSDLRSVFVLCWRHEQGWSVSRVLGVLLKVCEAAGYAHHKGVIHRDLKPSNVMVGRLGEVYVMDWGVARVLAATERPKSDTRKLSTVRASLDGNDGDSALRTADGEIVGTAAYMSPEQARGRVDELTPRSDVYAFGAMLYHLLAGHPPYAKEATTSHEVIALVRAGPPPPLARIAARAAPEVVAICDKAMSRDPARRYADLSECAEDMRAYLEGRVVRAHRSGAWTAARKWAGRNRVLATSLAVLLVGGPIVAWRLIRASTVSANLDTLTRLREPTRLIEEYDLLWPASEENRERMERWLAAADDVASRHAQYREQLRELRAAALPLDRSAPVEIKAQRQLDEQAKRGRRWVTHVQAQRDELLRTGRRETFDHLTMAHLEDELARDVPIVEEREGKQIEHSTWVLDNASDQLLHDRLESVIRDVEQLYVGNGGYSRIERVRRALAFLRGRVQADHAAEAALWEAAIRSIANATECPHYGGLSIRPQHRLLPIGRDPQSGLWELAHLQSGEPARRRPNGQLEITESTGLVLVLLRGVDGWVGSQNEHPDQPYFDPQHQQVEGPQMAVFLDTFFISKYEMTEAQWKRWHGGDRSSRPQFYSSSPLQAVEGVSWWESDSCMREFGLHLPSEAQWEYAARAGTTTPWSCGDDPSVLSSYANLLDSTLADSMTKFGVIWRPTDWRFDASLGADGYSGPAPVGSFRPNAFGLFDVHGNVTEWCGDKGPIAFNYARWVGTGARSLAGTDSGGRVARGGSFRSVANEARVMSRSFFGAQMRDDIGVGVRPARSLDP